MNLFGKKKKSNSTDTQLTQELPHGTVNIEELANSKSPIQYEPIPNTPFVLGEKDGWFFLVLGNSMLTEPLRSKKQTLELLETDKWNLIFRFIMFLMENQRKGLPKDQKK